MSTPTRDVLDRLENRREAVRAACESMLLERRGAGVENLTDADATRLRAMQDTLRELDDHIAHYSAELERVGSVPEALAKRALGNGSDAASFAKTWAANTTMELRRAFGSEQRAVISGSVDVPILVPEYVTDIPHPTRLIDLFPSRLAVDSMAYEYFRQIARTNNAAPVPDNTTKPTSVLTVQAIQDRCRVIAHLSEPLPFRIWLDEQAISAWLNAEMAAGVLDAIEAQAISGDGQGENCTGILSTPGTTAVAFATDVPTTLRKAVTALQNLGEVPTGWALNPADAELIDLERWGASGGFLTGGYENDAKTGFGISDNLFGTVPARRQPVRASGHRDPRRLVTAEAVRSRADAN